MAVAFDAFSASGDEPGASIGFTHTPAGTPRGALVLVAVNATTTDTVTTVTYGGESMAEISLSPSSMAAENGAVLHGFFLGASVPTGAQAVVVNTSAGFNQEAYAITYTAADDTEVVATDFFTATGVGDLTDTLALGGRTCHVAEVLRSALNSDAGIAPLTGWTAPLGSEGDWGGQMRACYLYDTVGSDDVTYGLAHANSEAVGVLAVAVSEVQAGGAAADIDVPTANAIRMQSQTTVVEASAQADIALLSVNVLSLGAVAPAVEAVTRVRPGSALLQMTHLNPEVAASAAAVPDTTLSGVSLGAGLSYTEGVTDERYDVGSKGVNEETVN